MAKLIDRRRNSDSKKGSSRKKFIDRNKKDLKKYVDAIADKSKITDIGKAKDIKVSMDPLDEPNFSFDPDSGLTDTPFEDNPGWGKGDRIPKPKSGAGQGGRGPGKGEHGEGKDIFSFTMSKKEFIEILFSDMELPDYIKDGILGDERTKLVRSGYTKEGPISKLNLVETLKNSIARRLAFKDKTSYLEDIDLRFNYHTTEPDPYRKAVMFCLMDVSYSMTEHMKDIAKRFFILLYLFLENNYNEVDIRFIRHHSVADEVTEEVFFYDKETGGTYVLEGYRLIKEIIDKDYANLEYNIYITHATDGDVWDDDDLQNLVPYVEDTILPLVQYLAYLEIVEAEKDPYPNFMHMVTLGKLFKDLHKAYKKLNISYASTRADIFPALKKLFKKGRL